MVTRWLHWILLCSWSVCFLLGALPRTSIWAQEGNPAEWGVLLLERDRIMQGRVSASKESYQVHQDAAGVVVVPKAQVRFHGPDLRSVYVFLLDGLPKDATADDHMKVARWCITYKLMSEARFELQKALEMDPSREDIRRNISILDSHVKRPPPAAKSSRSLTPAERRARAYGLGNDDVETLAGLSREAGQQFTTRIQPILIHNCTNSACHGPLAEHPLKFSIVRAGSTASHAVSEKNLLALMKYVDCDRPKSSPFWKILVTNHGAQGSSIFTGSKGPQQLQACKDWVRSLAINEELEEEPVKEVTRKASDAKVAVEKASVTKQRQSKLEVEPEPVTEPEDNQPASIVAAREPRKKVGSASDSKSKPRTAFKIVERRPPSKRDVPETSETKLVSAESTESNVPEVEPIVSKTREEIPELPAEDPFDPEVFNRRQRIKQNMYD